MNDEAKLQLQLMTKEYGTGSRSYPELKARFLAAAALNQVQNSSVDAHEFNADIDNGPMIQRFIVSLPMPKSATQDNGHLESFFVAHDAYESILLQASTFFYGKPSRNPNKHMEFDDIADYRTRQASDIRAYYVIGMNEATHELLACKVGNQDAESPDGPTIVRFSPFMRSNDNKSPLYGRKSGLRKKIQAEISTEFHRVGNDLDATARLSTPMSALVQAVEESDAEDSVAMIVRADTNASKNLPKLKGVSARFSTVTDALIGFEEQVVEQVTDKDMIEFDVPDHLVRLAAMFDKSRALQAAQVEATL